MCRTVHGSRKTCAVHKADLRSARGWMRACSTARTGFRPFGVRCWVLQFGGGGSWDFLVCGFPRRGTVSRRGGGDEQRCRQMALLRYQKGRTRTRDRQTAQLGRSAFRLTREGEVFDGGRGYVVVTKGRKWAKGWSLAGQFGKCTGRSSGRDAGEHGGQVDRRKWARFTALIC